MKKNPEELLSFYPSHIREIIDVLSGIIFQTFPNTKEKVYMGWRGLGYVHPQAGYYVGLFPQNDCVKMGFENGFAMSDKYNLFSDETKKVKYIVIKSVDEIDGKKIEECLIEAVELKL